MYQYYVKQTDSCETTCPTSFLKDEETLSCIKLPPCPVFASKGNNFHQSGTVDSIIIEKDQNLIYSHSYTDSLIKIWDYENGKQISTFKGHLGGVLKLKLGSISSLDWNHFRNLNDLNMEIKEKILKITQVDDLNTETHNQDSISVLISVSAIGDLIMWDRKKGNQILIYNIENGSINSLNSEIYLQ